ncbi:MAG TPA: hypothetical protein VF258_02410, partial [Luteolibacter sp.]
MEFRMSNFISPMISTMTAALSGSRLLPALLPVMLAALTGGCNRTDQTNRAPVSSFTVVAAGASKGADGIPISSEYKTLGEARRRWRIGVFFPHLKDD